MATSTSNTHVVKQSMHLRSRKGCHFDVEVVNEVGNRFKDVHLDLHQSLVNCHLQVTVKNFDELFKIEANIVIGEVQQCLSPSFTRVVCSHSTFKVTNHCNQSQSGIPVKHLKNPIHGPVYFQLVLCHHCNDLVRCELTRF